MTTLILFLPPRARLRAQGRAEAASNAELSWLLSSDGRQVSQSGRSLPQALPAAAQVVAVLADEDVAWRRVDLPRAGRQMRQALAGLLEEKLLDDAEQLHFALEEGAAGGRSAWVAICSRNWLAQQLAQLESAKVMVDRVVPVSCPGVASLGHVEDGRLTWSHEQGVATLSMQGALARHLISPGVVSSCAWTASPASVSQAEEWLGTRVEVRTAEQRALLALQSGWNLRQFELAARTRGLRQLRQVWREFMAPAWKPVRWGLIGLVALNLLGLNLLAWKLQRELVAQHAALSKVLTDTFPHVRAILDAPAQMRRETDTLLVGAGQPGPKDFETLLAAADAAWPAESGPVQTLAFEPGRLTLSASGWNAAQIEQFGEQLRSAGWHLSTGNDQLVISAQEVTP